MAPLPANHTSRLFLDYMTGNIPTSQEHTLSVRYASGVTPQTVQQNVYDLLTAVGAANFPPGWRVLRARTQEANSDFSLPMSLITALGAFVGTGGVTLPPREEPREYRWVGRSHLDGRKTSFSLYGLLGTTPDNYRLPRGGTSPAWVALSLNQLATFTTSFTNINALPVVFYDYVNVQYNTYWESRVRTG